MMDEREGIPCCSLCSYFNQDDSFNCQNCNDNNIMFEENKSLKSESEHESLKTLKNIGFTVIDSKIILSDKLPLMTRLVQKEIDNLCRNYDYECEMEKEEI